MGLFDNAMMGIKVTGKQPQNPQVTECENKLNELSNERNRLLLEIGKKYYGEHEKDMGTGTIYEGEMENILKTEKQMAVVEKRKLAVQGLRKCTACGNVMSLDSVFCNKCGEKQGKLTSEETMNSSICPECGAEREEGSVFCTMCGYKFTGN
jgi:ribosomal protein L40E